MSVEPARSPEAVTRRSSATRDGQQGGQSSVDRLEVALREKILAGVYPPGSRLVLTRLAQEHRVSIIPVREALQRLETERLVQIEQNRGARVPDISIADMRDIYETRVVLERHAIVTAIPLLSDSQLEVAEQALEMMEASFSAGQEREAYQAHEAFHFALYEPAGSAWTMHIIRQLWASAERYVRLAAGVRPAPVVFVTEHREIFDAVARKDSAAASESLVANLRTTERLLAENYETVPHRI